MTVEDNIVAELMAELEKSSDYRARRDAIDAFNAKRYPEEGLRADAGQVRHFLHPHPPQPGWRPGASSIRTAPCISIMAAPRWGRGSISRWRRSWPTNSASTRRVQITATTTGKVPNTSATAARPAPISTAWRPRRRRHDQEAARRLCRARMESAPRSASASRRPGHHRQPEHRFRRTDQAGPSGARAAFRDRLLHDAQDLLGPRQGARAGPSSISPMAPPVRK